VPRATSAILTNRMYPLSDLPFVASPSLNFRRAKKKADHGIFCISRNYPHFDSSVPSQTTWF
jgi:hypothetical protein